MTGLCKICCSADFTNESCHSGLKTKRFAASIGRSVLPPSVDFLVHAHPPHSRGVSHLFCCSLYVQILCILCGCNEFNNVNISSCHLYNKKNLSFSKNMSSHLWKLIPSAKKTTEYLMFFQSFAVYVNTNWYEVQNDWSRAKKTELWCSEAINQIKGLELILWVSVSQIAKERKAALCRLKQTEQCAPQPLQNGHCVEQAFEETGCYKINLSNTLAYVFNRMLEINPLTKCLRFLSPKPNAIYPQKQTRNSSSRLIVRNNQFSLPQSSAGVEVLIPAIWLGRSLTFADFNNITWLRGAARDAFVLKLACEQRSITANAKR